MAKRVVHLCDPCRAQGTTREATRVGVRVHIGDAQPLLLDLCPGHYLRMIEPILATLAVYGYPEEPAKPRRDHRVDRTTGPFMCKIGGCQQVPLKHYASFYQHLKRWHDMTITDYREKYGELVPMTPEEVAAFSLTVECELKCGESWSTTEGHRWPVRAMESHMWGVHGVKAARLRSGSTD